MILTSFLGQTRLSYDRKCLFSATSNTEAVTKSGSLTQQGLVSPLALSHLKMKVSFTQTSSDRLKRMGLARVRGRLVSRPKFIFRSLLLPQLSLSLSPSLSFVFGQRKNQRNIIRNFLGSGFRTIFQDRCPGKIVRRIKHVQGFEQTGQWTRIEECQNCAIGSAVSLKERARKAELHLYVGGLGRVTLASSLACFRTGGIRQILQTSRIETRYLVQLVAFVFCVIHVNGFRLREVD